MYPKIRRRRLNRVVYGAYTSREYNNVYVRAA